MANERKSEFYPDYTPPVVGFFTMTFTKDAALDLIVTLTAAVRDLDGVPEAVELLLEQLKELAAEAKLDIPGEGIAIADLDGDAA